MDAIILVGGKGTRLQRLVSDRPKPLAIINGTPFLDILLRYLDQQHVFSHVILSGGYLGTQIAERYSSNEYSFTISIVIESVPLGTGGAIQHCLSETQTESFFVCNGDSFVSVDLQSTLTFHNSHNGIGTIVTREVEDTARFGRIESDSTNRISQFLEKGREGRGSINAGMYFFRRDKFLEMDFPDKFSLEQDGFPKMIHKDLYSFCSQGPFIDIGTEESYLQAQQFFTEMSR